MFMKKQDLRIAQYIISYLFLLADVNSQLNALILHAGNSAFETADSIMGATNLIHMFARFVDAHVYLPIYISPCYVYTIVL